MPKKAGKRKDCMRGQSAIEFFLVASTLVLLFTWFANYAEVFYSSTSADSLRAQEEQIAEQIASLASASCFSNVSYNTTIACPIYRGKQSPIVLSVRAASDAVNVTSFLNITNASSTMACRFGSDFSTLILCTNPSFGKLCITRSRSSDTVNITLGGCI